MDAFVQQLLGDANGLIAYGAVFGVLLACGLGVPLPEDISLITGGYLAHRGAASVWVMMVVGFAGILAGDSMIFFAGRRVGTRVGRRPSGLLARVVTPEKRAKVEALFARHGQKIVMIARFLPGVRAVTYFTAGSAGMSYWRFALFDGLAALASAPIFVYLGFRFGGDLERLIENIKKFQLRVLLPLIGLIVVVVLVKVLLKRRRLAKERSLVTGATSIGAAAPSADEAVAQSGKESRALPSD